MSQRVVSDATGMLIDDAACKQDMKHCGKDWQKVQDIANQQDKNRNYLHPELHNELTTLQNDSRAFTIQNSSLGAGGWRTLRIILRLPGWPTLCCSKGWAALLFHSSQLNSVPVIHSQQSFRGNRNHINCSWPIPGMYHLLRVGGTLVGKPRSNFAIPCETILPSFD